MAGDAVPVVEAVVVAIATLAQETSGRTEVVVEAAQVSVLRGFGGSCERFLHQMNYARSLALSCFQT